MQPNRTVKLRPQKRGSGLSRPVSFSERVKALIRSIPRGRVCTYGLIAALAGDPRGARQVVRILHACSEKDRLPWQRVINAQGRIGLPRHRGYELQKAWLENEGVVFDKSEKVDFGKCLWKGPALSGKPKAPALTALVKRRRRRDSSRPRTAGRKVGPKKRTR